MKTKLFILILFGQFIFTNVLAQWTTLNSGTLRSLNRVDFPSVNIGYILPFSGPLLRTTNAGVSWDSISSITLFGSSLYDNNICFVNDSVGFITTHNNAGNARLYKTMNMGNTWTDISPLNATNDIFKVHFLNAQKGYLYANTNFNDRFWSTDNGGTSWTEDSLGFSLGSGTNSLPIMFFVNDSTGYIAGSDGSFLYRGVIAKTIDHGKHWSLKTLPQSGSLINDIHFHSEDTGYVISADGLLFRTTNKGSTWDSISRLNTTSYIKIFFINGKTGFVISGTNIYKTTDAGITWNLQPSGTSHWLWSVYFPDPNTGYIVGDSGTILKTSLGGTSSIKEISNDEQFFTLYPNPSTHNITIELKNSLSGSDFKIYDNKGSLVKHMALTEQKTIIDISDLAAGVYYLSLINQNRICRQKLILY